MSRVEAGGGWSGSGNHSTCFRLETKVSFRHCFFRHSFIYYTCSSWPMLATRRVILLHVQCELDSL